MEGSGACKLIGPKGEVELSQGVIIAKRHLHVRQEDAEKMGVKDKEIIKVGLRRRGPQADLRRRGGPRQRGRRHHHAHRHRRGAGRRQPHRGRDLSVNHPNLKGVRTAHPLFYRKGA